MKLSNETIELLKNFAMLNSNMLILEGSTQMTRTGNKTVCVVADFPQEFPKEFGVYELPKLLGAIKLFDTPELDFNSKQNAVVIKDEKAKFSFYGTHKDMLAYPDKGAPKYPEPADYSFVVPKDVLAKLKSVGLPHIVFESVDGVLKINTSDFSDKSSNVYEHILESESGLDDFQVHFKSEHLQMINGEYFVEVSLKGITRWTLKLDDTRKLVYYVANSKETKA